MNLGDMIRSYRTERGWSQAELGDRSKVDPAQIGRFERGVAEPELKTLRNIADAFNLECSELLDDAPKSCRRQQINEASEKFADTLERHTGDSSFMVKEFNQLMRVVKENL